MYNDALGEKITQMDSCKIIEEKYRKLAKEGREFNINAFFNEMRRVKNLPLLKSNYDSNKANNLEKDETSSENQPLTKSQKIKSQCIII